MNTSSNFSNVTEQELQDAYLISAKVVKLYGDRYLPLFERLHHECQKLKEISELKSIAFALQNDIMGQANEKLNPRSNPKLNTVK